MNYMKWHSISAVVMAVSAAVCIYSGHRLVSSEKITLETDSEKDADNE